MSAQVRRGAAGGRGGERRSDGGGGLEDGARGVVGGRLQGAQRGSGQPLVAWHAGDGLARVSGARMTGWGRLEGSQRAGQPGVHLASMYDQLCPSSHSTLPSPNDCSLERLTSPPQVSGALNRVSLTHLLGLSQHGSQQAVAGGAAAAAGGGGGGSALPLQQPSQHGSTTGSAAAPLVGIVLRPNKHDRVNALAYVPPNQGARNGSVCVWWSAGMMLEYYSGNTGSTTGEGHVGWAVVVAAAVTAREAVVVVGGGGRRGWGRAQASSGTCCTVWGGSVQSVQPGMGWTTARCLLLSRGKAPTPHVWGVVLPVCSRGVRVVIAPQQYPPHPHVPKPLSLRRRRRRRRSRCATPFCMGGSPPAKADLLHRPVAIISS